jgi:hypothetical protein
MSQLRCNNCDQDLQGTNVSIVGTEAQCAQCGTPIGRGPIRNKKRRPGQPDGNPIPAAVKVEYRQDGALLLRVPWRLQRPPSLTQLMWICTAFVVAFVCYEIGFSFWSIVISVVVTVGVLMSIRLFNATVITVQQGAINVSHAPLPWRTRFLQAGSIAQLYVDRRPLEQNKFDYSLWARDQEGFETMFVQALSDPVVALYLEQCLESQLQIVDEVVAGAFRPSQLHEDHQQQLQHQHQHQHHVQQQSQPGELGPPDLAPPEGTFPIDPSDWPPQG